MISALLMALCLSVLQFGTAVHVRNIMVDAASTGARFAALADRTPQDGVERTHQLISSTVSDRFVEDIQYQYVDGEAGRQLRITVSGRLPGIGIIPGVGEVEVSGSAYEFD